MTPKVKHVLLATLVASGMLTRSAHAAANPGFEYGDLILGFQTTGSGSASYVLANLGQAGTLRDANSNMSLGVNASALNSALVTQFGNGWFDRTDLFAGIFTAGSNSEFDGFFVNRDPYNTVYVGAPRQSVGTAGQAASSGYNLTPAAVKEAADGMVAAATIFENNGSGAISTISNGLSFVDYDDQNPISGAIQGASWNGVFAADTKAVFGPGTFGTLGGIPAEVALDLYRIQGVNDQPGQAGFGQPVGLGTYEGTIVVNNSGQVSLLVVPEPSALGLLAVGSTVLGLVRRRRSVHV